MIEVRTPAAPVEVVTPIKPSEALRLGRLIRPLKCQGVFFDEDGAACAIGAMHLGWGGDPDIDAPNELGGTVDRIQALTGLRSATLAIGSDIFDAAEEQGRDGDAAVLAYLAERGL